MRAVAYIHSGHQEAEIQIMNAFCRKHHFDLISFYMDREEEPLETRRALGRMLERLHKGEADCALCLTQPGNPSSMQSRFCSYVRCSSNIPYTGVCQEGFIAEPEMCIFKRSR